MSFSLSHHPQISGGLIPDSTLLTHYLDSVYEILKPLIGGADASVVKLSFQIGDFVPLFFLKETHSASLAGGFLITACNPRSLALSREENERRQSHLAEQLQERGWLVLPALGRDQANQWREESFLVLGATEEAIRPLMVQWEQNAWLWIDRVGQVHLRHHGQTVLDPSFEPVL